jgi:shikimate kinase
MNIYLVGFMATGKTAVGREVARKRGWGFIDLDELIELREKRVIAEIFAKEGEPYFRKLEKKALKDVAKEEHFVVACGGGVVLDKENIALMKKTGKLICLCAKPEVILKRAAGFAHRPLLNVKNPREKIGLLLKLRQPYYAQADTQIDTSGISLEKVSQKIIAAIHPKRRK